MSATDVNGSNGKPARKARSGLRLASSHDTRGDDWRTSLAQRHDGDYIGDERNVVRALRSAPELREMLRFNEFANRVEFQVPPPWRKCAPGTAWVDEDDVALKMWLQNRDVRVTQTQVVCDSVQQVARDWIWHPVCAYLKSLTWDREQRLGVWLAAYMSAAGDAEYLRAVGTAFMISAVARVMKPGCQADYMLVLEGGQGLKKTSAARTLAVNSEWFTDNLSSIHSKDASMQLAGRWIIEMAELAELRNSEVESMKSFVTRRDEKFRPPYGRRVAQFNRQCVFIGTTNEVTYLRDRTGNRRFWPVRCRKINFAALERDRDQLWAEALHLFESGAQWHLTDDEEQLAVDEQRERVQRTEIETDVALYLHGLRDKGEVSVREVLVQALKLDDHSANYAEAARKLGPVVADALVRAGWEKVRRVRGDGAQRTVYRWAGTEAGS